MSTIGLSHSLIERYSHGEECAFWFLRADKLRGLAGVPGAFTLRRMQTLRAERPSWLVQKTIRFVDLCAGAYRREFLTLSHRWEAPDDPDPTGAQAATILHHLQEHLEIQYVWIGAITARRDSSPRMPALLRRRRR